MITTAFVLALVTLSGIDATCQCYSKGTVTGKKVAISNAYDNTDFSACYSACGFVADSGDKTVGWTNITVKFSSKADPTGTITVYDSTTNDANKYITSIKASEDTGSGVTKTLTSSTSSIYVQYTQSDTTKSDEYYGTLVANSGLQAPTTTAIPTTAPTTTPYISNIYSKNPKLISHDMLILINQKTSQGMTGLNALNNLTTQLIDLLAVTTDPSGSSQTRLGLATLTPYAPNFAAQGEIWNMLALDVIQALPKAGVSSNVDIINGLKQVVTSFFNVNDTVAPTRRQVQRSVVLFTAWWNDGVLDTTIQEAFAANGVNLAIIGYNTSSDLLIPNSWYNYVSLTDTKPSDVASFVNRFFLNSGFDGNSLINNWCAKGADQLSNTPYKIQEPSDYSGPKDDSTDKTWGLTDGQKGRYCNFQDTTYTYNRVDPSKKVKVTLFYELEIENDFLKFWADGKEVESFTGIDVSSAYFIVDANTTTARFTTDSAEVMRGFQASFTEV